MTKGMDHYHAQEKDRQNWQASIDKRRTIIGHLKFLGVKQKRLHEMRTADLEAWRDKLLKKQNQGRKSKGE